MNLALTIYVLAYNRPDYLRECLQSILNQTRRNFQVVVLDNASDRDLQSVVQAFGALKIRYVRHPHNVQSTGNFLHAWKEAKNTPYFMVFHDDDVMHPQLVERVLSAMSHPAAPAWAGSHSLGFTERTPSFPELGDSQPVHLGSADLAYRLLTGSCDITFSSVIYRSDRTSAIDLELIIQEHSIVADRPMLFALAKQGGCALSPLPLVLYRCHPDQDSKTGPLNEDNSLALFTTYRRTLEPIWGRTVERDFYRWSGFHIPDGYRRLAPTKRSSFRKYLEKARVLDVYRDPFLGRFLLGSVETKISRFRRIPKKILELIDSKWLPPKR